MDKGVNEKFYEQDGKRSVKETQNLLEEYRFFHILQEVDKLARLGKSASLRIVDAGAGWGQLSVALARKGHRVISLDISESRLCKFQKEAKALNITQIKTFLDKIPLQDSSIDLIICSEVLEHLPNPRETAMEFNRITRAQGFLVLTVPYAETLMKVLCPQCFHSFVPHGHIHSFDFLSLQNLFEATNYANKQSRVIGKRLTSALLRRKLICFHIAKVLDIIQPARRNHGWSLSTWQKKEGHISNG